jgi:DNA-binding IclR family transcriptional regulator
LRRLLHAVDETCHLVVYDSPDVVYIDKVENEQTVRMASRIGSRVPAYRTAVGKAILAWLGEDALQPVIDAGMPPITERTTTDPGQLRAELERVRRRGYAVDDRENEPEVPDRPGHPGRGAGPAGESGGRAVAPCAQP